ncbi:hypothetical protein BLOT_009259 [Blomia tropicalis]|nr:hypothetical protein BLOT_009259 [Blomia tropicalis]
MNAKDTSVKLRKEIVLIYNLVMATVELDEQDVVQINKVLNDYKEWNRSVLKSNDEIIIDENEEAVYRQMILVLKERLMTTKLPSQDTIKAIREYTKIKSFSGNFSDFNWWIDQFKTGIGSKLDISSSDKCIALKNLLDDKTLSLVKHCTNDVDGYHMAMDRLTEYFGDRNEIIRECFSAIKDVKLDIDRILEWQRNVFVIANIAERFKQTNPDSGQVKSFKKMIAQKLPETMVDRYARDEDVNAPLDTLIQFLFNEVEYVKHKKVLKSNGSQIRWKNKRGFDKHQSKVEELRKCNYCRKPGHLFNDCPDRLALICFKCGVKGHIQKNCFDPNVKNVNSIKDKKQYVQLCAINEATKECRPQTKLTVNNQTLDALVDSCAVITIIPEKLVKEAKEGPIVQFGMADGTPMNVKGPFEIWLKMDNYEAIKWPVYTQKNDVPIIGADLLKANNALIDMAKGTVTMQVSVVGDNDKLKNLVDCFAHVFEGIDTLSRIGIAVINNDPRHVDVRIRSLVDRFPNKYVQQGNRIIMLDVSDGKSSLGYLWKFDRVKWNEIFCGHEGCVYKMVGDRIF